MLCKIHCLFFSFILLLTSCATIVKNHGGRYEKGGAKLIVFRVDPIYSKQSVISRRLANSYIGDEPVISIDGTNAFNLVKNEFVALRTEPGWHRLGVTGNAWGPFQFKSVETPKQETVYLQVSENQELVAAVARNALLWWKPVKYLSGIPTYQIDIVSKQDFESLSGRLREHVLN